MPLDINIRISSNEDGEISQAESTILAALANLGGEWPPAGTSVSIKTPDAARAEEIAEAVVPTPKPAPVRRTRKAAAPSTRAAVLEDDEPAEEPAAEEAPAPVEEAPVEEAPVEEAPVEEAPVEEAPAEEAPAYTLDDAVSRATELVKSGKAAQLKAALKAAGAARVKDLKGDEITTFITALEG